MRINRKRIWSMLAMVAFLCAFLFLFHWDGTPHPVGKYQTLDVRGISHPAKVPLVLVDSDSKKLRVIWGRTAPGPLDFIPDQTVVVEFDLSDQRRRVVDSKGIVLQGWRGFATRPYLRGGWGVSTSYVGFPFPTWAPGGLNLGDSAFVVMTGKNGIAQLRFEDGDHSRLLAWKFVFGDATQTLGVTGNVMMENEREFAILPSEDGNKFYLFRFRRS